MVELSRRSSQQGVNESPSIFPTPPPPLMLNYNIDYNIETGVSISDMPPLLQTSLHDAFGSVTTFHSPNQVNTRHANASKVHKFGEDFNKTFNMHPEKKCASIAKYESSSELVNLYHTYIKKSPVSFIDLKYWRGCVAASRTNKLNKWRYNFRMCHLMKAFYSLYREYSYVCDTCLPTYQDQLTNATIQDCMLKAHGDQIHSEMGRNKWKSIAQERRDEAKRIKKEKILKRKNKLIINSDSDRQDDDSLNSFCSAESIAVKPSKLSFPYFAKQMTRYGKKYKHNKNKTPYYDCIESCKSVKTLRVHIKNKVRHIRTHQYCRLTLDSSGHQKKIWGLVPIALELLLPKIQAKVENVMNSCSFLIDPLEVLSELRYFNYNEAACIDHFQKTLDLRSIIEEFVPLNKSSHTGGPTHLSADDSLKLDIENYRMTMEELSEGLFPSKIDFNKIVEASSKEIEDKNIQTNIQADTEISEYHQDYWIGTETKELCVSSTKYNSSTQTHNEKDRETREVLMKTLEGLKVLKNSKESLEAEVKSLKKKFATVITLLVRQVTAMMGKLKTTASPTEQKIEVRALHNQVKGLKLRLQEEEKRRKTVFNMMQEQMGNIRVYCRCRDVPDRKSMLNIPSHDSVVINLPPCEEFKFDKVFGSDTNQSELYREFEPLVLSFIDGYNVCFITYGGEASGKTYTLVGENDKLEDHGLMQRALRTVLNERKIRQRDWAYKINAAIVEIYNDTYADFLGPSTATKLHIDGGLEAIYQSLKNVPINNEKDVEALIQVCRLKRRTARTALNPASSRSHLVTLIRLRGVSQIHGEQFCSFMGLWDLAGFEDIIKAETHNNQVLKQEASFINRSLTAFNRVFVALRRQDPNTVAYRETKLTYLLKPFLTNSGKCCLVITVRTDKNSLGSTQNTLRFGKETRGVKLGRAKRQIDLE